MGGGGAGGGSQEFYCTLKLLLDIMFWSDSERQAALIFSRPFSGYLCCRTRGLKFSLHATMLHHIGALKKSQKDSKCLSMLHFSQERENGHQRSALWLSPVTASSAYQHLSPVSYSAVCQDSYGQWKSTKKMFRCITLYV